MELGLFDGWYRARTQGTDQCPGASKTDPDRGVPTAVGDAGDRVVSRRPGQEPSSIPKTARVGAREVAVRCEREFRFSKHNGEPVNFPLGAEDAQRLKKSNAVSPTLPDDHRVV
ncbi:MAG: hypothetical protein AAFY60_16490, partial [Myxococcota bacterium]